MTTDPAVREAEEFWKWVSAAYRGATNPGATFTIWNMEVAYRAGQDALRAENERLEAQLAILIKDHSDLNGEVTITRKRYELYQAAEAALRAERARTEEQSAAADMIAEEREAWKARAEAAERERDYHKGEHDNARAYWRAETVHAESAEARAEAAERDRDLFKTRCIAEAEYSTALRNLASELAQRAGVLEAALHEIAHARVGTLDPAGDGGTYILTGHEYRQLQQKAREALAALAVPSPAGGDDTPCPHCGSRLHGVR